MRRFSLSLVLILLLNLANAQDRTYIAGGVTPGFMLAHRLDIKHMGAHNYGLELTYEKEAQNTYWGKFYRRPTVGFTAMYYDLGVDIAGSAWAGLANVKFYPFELGNANAVFRIGAGLGYLTKHFDPYTNRRNQAIGSNLNGSMQFSFMMHHDVVKDQGYFEYGLGISHFSNAAFKMPNLGYNMPAIFVRCGTAIGEREEKKEVSNEVRDNWDLRATLVLTKKQENLANPVDFFNKGIQLRMVKADRPIRSWNVGIDAMLDKTYKYIDDPVYPLDSVAFGEQLEVGVAGGPSWDFGQLKLYTELGIYAYRPYNRKNLIYERVGLRYHFNDRLSIQGALKFHKGVADYFESGLSYSLAL